MEDKKLINYGGQGYGYSDEDGIYEVRTNEKDFRFEKLSDAIMFFENLDGERFIWDLTKSFAELLDGYCYE